ncbi:MAG: class I SAM-dependent methyltransferase [Wenzhouxiangellaceae bacterium]
MRIALMTVCASLLVAGLAQAEHAPILERVEKAMNGDHRSEANRARNEYRHPLETLEFFGLKDGMTVMEIWPGGGWYTEILAPAMRDHGTYIAASYDPDVPDQPEYRYRLHKQLLEKFAAEPELYDQAKVVHLSPPLSIDLGEENSVDMILTFRNAHGWFEEGIAEGLIHEFAHVIKPGGILGIVQHRAEVGAHFEDTMLQGYLPEQTIIDLAFEAGFELDGKSEINANPKDTRDHPEGVWTLPPSLRLGDQDRAKYEAIGESDRMTLRFKKVR